MDGMATLHFSLRLEVGPDSPLTEFRHDGKLTITDVKADTTNADIGRLCAKVLGRAVIEEFLVASGAARGDECGCPVGVSAAVTLTWKEPAEAALPKEK